jgi:uncharacterized membrane protein YecN with MAPEG domain
MTFLVCSAILVILYFVLALNVSMTRRRTKTGIGTGDDPAGPMNKAVRAHGNAGIEWVALIVTVSRVLHAMGMLMSQGFNRPPHPLRSLGALGTYAGGLALGIALLMSALL